MEEYAQAKDFDPLVPGNWYAVKLTTFLSNKVICPSTSFIFLFLNLLCLNIHAVGKRSDSTVWRKV